ncbi:HAD family phosphatase [Candidatus Woesearchaeota archaeon]|nr:HAD family phosphatase [Candidatus Woesearchaeota archaeon]
MIKCVIFDLGNVTIKFDEIPTFKKWSSCGKYSFDEVKNYYKNSSARKAFERGEITPKQFYEKYVKYLKLNITRKDFEKCYCDIFSRNSEVEKIIKSLKGKVKLVLLSNTNEWQYEYARKRFKIIDLFDEYVLSYKAGMIKPNPMIFLDAVKKSKTMPWNCAYFDDIPEFVYMARMIGIKAFKYKNAETLKRNLKEVGVLA